MDVYLRELSIRIATTSDIPEMVRLINSVYKRVKTEKYFLWQYFQCYYPTVCYLAFLNSNIVGMVGVQKKRLNNGIKIAQLIDILIDEKWRRKGLFTELGKRASSHFSDVKAVCVIANERGRDACTRALGFENIGKIKLVVKNSDTIDLENVPSRRKHKTVYFKKNRGVLEWRYGKKAQYDYTRIKDNENNMVICKKFTDPETNEKFGDVVDIICDISDCSRVSQLYSHAITYFSQQRISSSTTWILPHIQFYPIVVNLGFSESTNPRYIKYLCLKVVDESCNYLYNFKRWHIVQGDSDVY